MGGEGQMPPTVDQTNTPAVTITAPAPDLEIDFEHNIVVVDVIGTPTATESTPTPEATPTIRVYNLPPLRGCLHLDPEEPYPWNDEEFFCFYTRSYDGKEFIRYQKDWSEEYPIRVDNITPEYWVTYGGQEIPLDDFIHIQSELKLETTVPDVLPTPVPDESEPIYIIDMEDLIPDAFYNMDYLNELVESERYNPSGEIINEGVIATSWDKTISEDGTSIFFRRFEQWAPDQPWVFTESIEPLNPQDGNFQVITHYQIINGTIDTNNPVNVITYQYVLNQVTGEFSKVELKEG